MAQPMEWFIGGVLVLIVGIVTFIMTGRPSAIIVPIGLFLFGVYKLVTAKK